MTDTSNQDAALVAAFARTFEHYLKSKESQPIDPEDSINLLGSADAENDLRIRMNRAAAMRKFTFAQRDTLYIANVIRALNRLTGEVVEAQAQESLDSLLEDLLSGNVGPLSINEGASGAPTPDSDIVRDAIYGLLLHGDLEKLDRHVARHTTSINLALFSWLRASERLCHLVYLKAKAATLS